MIPIKVNPSKIKIRNENGEFEEVAVGAANLGTTVNIDDNAEGSDSTWSSTKLKSEIQSVVQQVESTTSELDQKIQDSKQWTLLITSSNGKIYSGTSFETILSVELYHGSELVTDQYDDSQFIWKRESIDKDGDVAWNATHNTGTKSLTITGYDTVGYSTTEFECQFWDFENNVMLASSL